MDNYQMVAALAGNPNVGKSTIFNGLTGLRQKTGNWAGVTVASACGEFTWQGKTCILVDLPGTYSLNTHSKEEEIAREYLSSGKADSVVGLRRHLHRKRAPPSQADSVLRTDQGPGNPFDSVRQPVR